MKYLIVLLALCLSGCAQFNLAVSIGGTVNQVPVTKYNHGGTMVSTSAQDEANTHSTSIPVSLTK